MKDLNEKLEQLVANKKEKINEATRDVIVNKLMDIQKQLRNISLSIKLDKTKDTMRRYIDDAYDNISRATSKYAK